MADCSIIVNVEEPISEPYSSGLYKDVMGNGLLKIIWRMIHRQMERPFDGGYYKRILELGAGNGEHREFVRSSWDEYHETDLRLDMLKTNSTKTFSGVYHSKQDIQKIDFPDNFFDRVIISCVLAHVENPLAAIKEIKRVAKPDSFVTIYVPCEPGIVLRIMRRISTIPKNKKLGVSEPYFLHFQEHRNYFLAMDFFIKFIFKKSRIKISARPIRFLTWNFSLYKIYQIKVTK